MTTVPAGLPAHDPANDPAHEQARPGREYLIGRGVGVVVCAFFGTAWVNWGMSVLTGPGRVAVLGVAWTVAVALLAGAAVLVRLGRRAPSLERDRDPAVARRFGVVVAIEWGGLAVLAAVTAASGHPEWVPALVCLGVGVHFWPLAALFAVPVYRFTGVAMCLAAVAAAVAATVTGHAVLWTVLPGVGGALSLFATGAVSVVTLARAATT